MKNKQFLTAALAAILAASMFTACSGGASDSSADSSGDTGNISSEASNSSDDSSETEESSVEIEHEKYVLDGDITNEMISLSRLNEGNKVRLASVLKKLAAGEEVTVGFIGGSITQGTSAGESLCYAKLTYDAIAEMYPNAKVNYINAGIGATGSYIGVHRVQKDLLDQKPDLVFVEFSVNDTTENTERNKQSYDSLLTTIWNSEASPAIITVVTTQENGTSFAEHHYEIAKHYDIPMISYQKAILEVIKHGDILWSDISGDNIHPNVPGHKIVSQLIMSYIKDVAADIDSISGEESDFSTSATGAPFANGRLLSPSDTEPVMEGFTVKEGYFGGFNGVWLIKSESDGSYGGAYLEFETEAKTVGILYGKLIKNGGKAEVYIDGELAATINEDFSGGWGNYVDCAEIKNFGEIGKHTVKIVPIDQSSSTAVYISALAVS